MFASLMAIAVAASSTPAVPVGLRVDDARALYSAYVAALDQGFQTMGPAMKRVAADYCRDGQSIEGYCTRATQGAIIGSHLSGDYEDVLRYSGRFAAAILPYLRSSGIQPGPCLAVSVTKVDARTNRVAASWGAHVASLSYFAQTRLSRQSPTTFYQAFYCARRASNSLFDTYDPARPGVPATDAELRVARKFEAEILQPLRAAERQVQADFAANAGKDDSAPGQTLLKTSTLYRNAYAACSRARFPANLCGYLSADSIEADFYASN